MLKSADKKYLWSIALLGLLCFFPLAMPESFHIDEAKNPLFLSFPNQIGDWKGQDSEVDQRTYEILETRNVLSREYQNPQGQRLHLLLVSSRKDRRVAHPPEVCYSGSNYTIIDARENQVTLGDRSFPVKEFTAKSLRNPSDLEHVIYLYRVGRQFTASYYSQQIRFALDRLSRQDSEVLLIRVAGKRRDLNEKFLTEVIKDALL